MQGFLTAPSYEFTLYMAGDYDHAKRLLQRYATRGECVSITRTDYVYKYGSESGFAVKLIHYPRFQRTQAQLQDVMIEIAQMLLEELGQGSFTITGPEQTLFYDRRD